MISPSAALNNPLNLGSASTSPLVTANKMHNMATDNLEGSEHSDILPFALVANQSTSNLNTSMADTSTMARASDALAAPLALTPDNRVTASLPQQLPANNSSIRPLSISTAENIIPVLTTPTNSNSNITASQATAQVNAGQYLPQQGYSPQFMPAGTVSSSMPLTEGTFQNFASIKPAIAALAADPSIREAVDSVQHIIAATSRSQPAVTQWGPVSVSQAAPMMQQAQEMLSPLREQLRFQIDQQIKQAELRLDPPELGKVELNIRLDGDRLHIQMHAANPAVRDALLMGLDRLRIELAMDHGGQIDVDINQDGQHRKENQQAQTASVAPASAKHNDSFINDLSQQDDVDLLA